MMAADTELVQRWESADTRISEVAGALAGVRTLGNGDGVATRAAVVNLVVLAAADDGAVRAVDSIIGLGLHHPGRIIVVVPRAGAGSQPGPPGPLAARVELYQNFIDGRRVWWDVVRLEVGGEAAAHAESLVDPLLLPELHVALWLVGGTSQVSSPSLLDLADQLIVSGERAALASPREVGADLTRLSHRRPLVDLAWLATYPGRQALARLFDPPARRVLLREVAHLRVAGPPWSSRLLAAWLAERLDVPLSALTVEADDRLRAELDVGSRTAYLDAGPVWPAGHLGGSGSLPPGTGAPAGSGPGAASATLGDARVIVPHGGAGTPQLLASALVRPWRDRRYEAALALAGKLRS